MKATRQEESFEHALKRLEQVVQHLEGGDLSLEESLTLFEEGVRLAKVCSKRLDEAEKKIALLAKGEDGTLSVRNVDPSGFSIQGADGEGPNKIG